MKNKGKESPLHSKYSMGQPFILLRNYPFIYWETKVSSLQKHRNQSLFPFCSYKEYVNVNGYAHIYQE